MRGNRHPKSSDAVECSAIAPKVSPKQFESEKFQPCFYFLAEKREPKSRGADLKFNNSMVFHQMPMPKKILLNINGPPLVNMVSDLQIVFMDLHCKKCIDCMERAIKAYKSHYYIVKNRPRSDELHEEVLKHRHHGKGKSMRNKREINTSVSPVPKLKRTKSKKKASKSVTVTKYNVDGEVYGLKVRETNTVVNAEQQNDTQSTCQVYSVKKSFPCDTPEGESFLTVTKRKATKKNKREKDRNKVDVSTTTTTIRPHFNAPLFRKRQIDNSQVPENFMPSIEEMY